MKLLQENERLNNRIFYLEKRIEDLEDLIAELTLKLEEATDCEVLGADIF